MTSIQGQQELHEIVFAQAAEDAFLSPVERGERLTIMTELLEPYPADAREEAIGLYVGHVANFRGEKTSLEEAQHQEVDVVVDFGKIGWLDKGTATPHAKIKKEAKEAKIHTVSGKRIELDGFIYNFVDMAETDKVAKKYRDEVLAKDPKLMAKITDEIIPQLWDDVMSGRGRQRPISIGSNYHVSRSLRADRCLDTQYPGYKLNVNGNSKRAILLILDRAEDQTPQFALAALYEHPDQPKIWNRMFINKMGSKE